MSARFGCHLVLLLLCFACDGIGRSVVGEHYGRFEIPDCDPALPCEALTIVEPENVPDSASAIDLRVCEPAGTLCQSSEAPSSAGTVQCALEASDLERTFEESVELREVGCSALRLTHTRASGEPALVRIEPEAWRQVHLEVETDEPATLELAGGLIEHVSLALRGPVTLRVLDSDELRDLRVVASDAPVQIELTRVRAGRVAIEAPESAVLLRRSTLDAVAISAQRIDLESSYVSDAVFRGGWLNAADATLLRVKAEVERSVLSACDATMLSLSDCRSFTSVQGHFTDVHLSACSEEVSVYGSALVYAQLEGNVLLDGASLGSAVLGLGDVGPISTWDTSFNNVTFCADQHSLSFGGSTAARCAHCDLAAEPVSPDACLVSGSEARVESSPSCDTLAAPPRCGDPQPERMRPPRM